MVASTGARFLRRRYFETGAKVRQMHQCALGLRGKIMNGTLVVSVSYFGRSKNLSHKMFMTWGTLPVGHRSF
jgi:hypothetical protein